MGSTASHAERRRLLLGLIGAGIGQSLTPALHEEEGAAQGLRVHYQTIDLDRTASGVEALPQLLGAARTMGFAGLNITYPCKQAVLALLDALAPEARAMGAVNTVVFDGVRAVGHNTDGRGWRWAFERGLPGADLGHVVLLGAGGAGAAIAHALMEMPVGRLSVVDAAPARAHGLVAELRTLHPGRAVEIATDPGEALAGASGLVHATPTGMDKQPGLPLPAALLRPALWVSEVVYFPLVTPLLAAARACGCATLDGGGMAVGQAVLAFELFTGRRPDAERMEAHLRRLLAERAGATARA